MPHARRLLIAAVSGLSISLLPIDFSASPLDGGVAHAKNDKSGGNGNGGGNAGGNGGGNGKSSAGKSNSAGGKSAAAGQSSSSAKGASKGLLDTFFGGGKTKSVGDARTSKKKNTAKAKPPKQQRVVSLPASVEAPTVKPVKEKNLNARLAGLNSLKRSVNAYLNSNSPRMAAIRDYVIISAEFELATEAAAEAAQAALDAQAAFDTAVGAIVSYNDQTVTPNLQALTDRRTALDAAVGLDEAETAAIEAEKAALDKAIEAANSLATAEQAALDAEAAAALEAEGTDDVALAAALEAAANKNRLEQYGDEYINDEVMGWAKDVLDEKIDGVKETLAAEAVEPAQIEPAPLEPEPAPLEPEPLEPVL